MPGVILGSVMIGMGIPMVLVAELTVVPGRLQGRAVAASEAIINTPFAIAADAALISRTGFQPICIGVAAGFTAVGIVLLPYLKTASPGQTPSGLRAAAVRVGSAPDCASAWGDEKSEGHASLIATG